MKSFIEIDVREDLKAKKEPFDKIMGAINDLEEGQDLILHAPFNPVPLHDVLKRKGYENQAEQIDRKHWKVTYVKQVESES